MSSSRSPYKADPSGGRASPLGEEQKGLEAQKAQEVQKTQKAQKATPKRSRPVIRHDFLNPRDYLKYNLPWACEDCSHYNFEGDYCSFGYSVKWHKRAYQEHSYKLGGRMALCRFQEID